MKTVPVENKLPVKFEPRPGMDDPRVRAEWAKLIAEYIPFDKLGVTQNWILSNLSIFAEDNLNLHICNLLPNISIDDPDVVPFYMTNQEVSILASKIEPCMEAAYTAVIREWVIRNGVRFNPKEGDAVEFADPENGTIKIGTVLPADKGMARGRVQYRNPKGETVYRIFNAEDILKIYNKGVPFDNTPRGGKVGITYREDTMAQALAA